MKKFLTLLLAALMLVSCMSAFAEAVDCSPYYFDYEGFPIYEEAETITMMGAKHPIHGEWADLMFFDIMEEATNISFEYNTIAWDSFSEQLNIAVNTESYAEVMFGCMLTNKQLVDWGSQGILIPLEDYITEELTPNLYAFLEQYPTVKGAITATDGHIYALPQLNAAPIAYLSSWWVNYEWMEALGVTDADLPTTVEGLLDLARRMRDEDPNGNGEADEIPIVLQGGLGNLMVSWLGAFGMLNDDVYIEEGVAKYGMLESEKMVEFLSVVKTMYDEGLINADFLTCDQSSMAALGAEGRLGMAMQAIPTNIWQFDTSDADAANAEAAQYPVLPALGYNGSTPVYPHTSNGITTGTFALTDLCEANGHVEAMMKWVDYLYSEEGSLLIHYGPVDYAYFVDENGVFNQIGTTDGRSYEERRGGSITPDCGLPLPKYVRPTTEGNWSDALQQRRNQQNDEKLVPYAQLAYPQLFFTEDENNELATLETDLDTFIESVQAKFVTGELDLANYETEVVEPLKNNFKIDRYLEIYQAAYDRYVEALG